MTEQFGLNQSKGFDAFLIDKIGGISKLADCMTSIEKMESDGLILYAVMLDPAKCIASDEILGVIAKAGDPVREALFSISFDADGRIASIDLAVSYKKSHSMTKHLLFSGFDSTVIDAMPVADRTYEDMKADMKPKIDAAAKQLESGEGESTSTTSADAK